MIYVSITGLRIKRRRYLPVFWWHAILSMRQAQRAPGLISVSARAVAGWQHTLTVWQSRDSMRLYLREGAHGRAMRSFNHIAYGIIHGYEAEAAPDWATALRQWKSSGRRVGDFPAEP
jgi:hypothetical protein